MKNFMWVITLLLISWISWNVGKHEGFKHGEKQGIKNALKTNPPSEEFEYACLGLWLGEQNKKAYQKWLNEK